MRIGRENYVILEGGMNVTWFAGFMWRGVYVEIVGFLWSMITFLTYGFDGGRTVMLLVVVFRVVEEGRIWIILLDDCRLGIIFETGTCVASVGCTNTILLADNLLYCPRTTTGTTTGPIAVVIFGCCIVDPPLPLIIFLLLFAT